jgi:tetratricopeptide (TPR) repeat protein
MPEIAQREPEPTGPPLGERASGHSPSLDRPDPAGDGRPAGTAASPEPSPAPPRSTPPASQRSWSWGAVAKSVLGLPATIKAVVGVLVVGLALVATFAEMTGRLVVIEPFDVAEILQKKHGYTSRVIANKLTDHLTRIRTTARTSMERRQFVAPGSANANFHALGGDANLDALLPYLWALVGKDRLGVVGEIVVREPSGRGLELDVTTRIAGKSAKTVSGPVEEIDDLLRQSAEHIYLHVQPYVLASALYETDGKRAFEVIQFVLRTEPATDDARAYNLWGLLARDAGHVDDAVLHFRDAVRVSTEPDIRARASTNLAAALYALGQYDEALAAVKRAVEARPAHAEAHHVWGLILAAQHDPATQPDLHRAAIAKLQEAIRVDPKFVPGYLSLGEQLERRGQIDAAIEQYQRAADLDRAAVVPHLRIAQALQRARRVEDAKRHLQQTIELLPNSPELEMMLGIVLFDEGELPDALACFLRAKTLAPRDPVPSFYAAQIYRMGEEPDKAVTELRQYLQLAPSGPRAAQARRLLDELQRGAPTSSRRGS